MSAQKKSISYNKKELVAEQSGFFWSSLGLLIAILLGSVTQAVFSPDRIKAQIQIAANRVHEQMEVTFDHAHLSLANGLFPEIAVVVSDVHLASGKKCWLTPELFANEIKLPLSIMGLITGKVTVNTVIVDEAQLRLRSKHGDCSSVGQVPIEATSPQATKNVSQSAESNSKNENQPKYEGPRNPIENVLIRTFHVTYEPAGIGTVRLDKIRFRREKESKDLHVEGLFNLGAETLAADYSSFASFKFDYKAAEDAIQNGEINGNWREGNYQFQFDYAAKRQNLVVLGDLQHIPVSQILPALKKYNLIGNDLDGKSLWLSQKISFQGSLQEPKSQVLRIEHLSIEGDLGEIKGSRLEFESVQPLKLKPFELDLHGIGIEKLLKAFNKSHPGPSLGSLGVFTGKLKFYDENHIELKGDHSGLEFIFSSQGHRESQIISLIRGGIIFNNNFWNLDLNEVRPLEGIFDGKIDLKTDREWQNVKLNVNFDELQLAPRVVSLVTSGGAMSPISGKFDLSLSQGEVKALNGRMQIKNLSYNRVDAVGFSLNFTTQAQTLFAKTQIQNLEVPLDWAGLQNIEPLQKIASTAEKPIQFSDLSGSFEIQSPSSLQWKEVRARNDKVRVHSSGGWNSDGIMSGKFVLNVANESQNWVISGDRKKLSWIKQ